MSHIEIMDTTLRDGEQMQGVSFASDEKLTISKILLKEVGVNRLEVTSARASEGEKKSVEIITKWAAKNGVSDKLEILSFVDNTKSIDWAMQTGIHRINLLTKGSLKHCKEQLKKNPQEHIDDISRTIEYASKNNIEINVYLEDFTNGIKDSPEYVYFMIDKLIMMPVKRIMLPDTLGVFNPFDTYEYVNKLVLEYPEVHFDFHPHNDYGFGSANILAAVKAGAKGVHVTVNGLGERAGNAALDEVCVSLKDFLGVQTDINEKALSKISNIVESFSGQRMSLNKPIYGSNVFIQTAGVHADGDKKGNLYANKLVPERFGRVREYALGKLSGKANLDFNLNMLGIELDDDKKKILLDRIVELGDKKKSVTPDDLPYLISDIFETQQNIPFKIIDCAIITTTELKPTASIKCSYGEKISETNSSGDGGYDAFMKALELALVEFNIPIPKLLDYTIIIPPGGNTDALVQASITWQISINDQTNNNTRRKTVVTKGVNSDQILAAIEATVKVINIICDQI